MLYIKKDFKQNIFSRNIPPVAQIKSNTVLVYEVLDASGGRIKNEQDFETYIADPAYSNPVTGPVYIEDSLPGDTLAVEIIRIEFKGKGILKVAPNVVKNVPGEKYAWGKIISVKKNEWVFNDELSFPIKPMVGVIGTAPAEGEISPAYAGDWGGNLDINEICVGSTVYLPVFVAGGLLSLGDVHISMGDGEVCAGGINVCAEVEVNVKLIAGESWTRPWIKTPDKWITCANAASEKQAISLVTSDMVQLLQRKLNVPKKEAYLIIGSVCDLGYGHIPDWNLGVTMKLSMKRS